MARTPKNYHACVPFQNPRTIRWSFRSSREYGRHENFEKIRLRRWFWNVPNRSPLRTRCYVRWVWVYFNFFKSLKIKRVCAVILAWENAMNRKCALLIDPIIIVVTHVLYDWNPLRMCNYFILRGTQMRFLKQHELSFFIFTWRLVAFNF